MMQSGWQVQPLRVNIKGLVSLRGARCREQHSSLASHRTRQ